MLIGSNCNEVANASDEYADFDDIAVYNVTPPNRDATGRAFIGSLGGGTVDTQPPVRTNGVPSGTLASGTTSIVVSLSTSENATCRYATQAGVAYGSMTGSFSATGAMSHSFTATGLTSGTSYSMYVRCQDGAGNVNPDDYVIAFNVAAGGVRPSAPRNLRVQ